MHQSAYDEVVERVAARAKAIRLGYPQDSATGMGPLVPEAQMQRVLDYIEIGRREGATVVTGGKRHGERGYYVSPTVFAGVAPEMRISQEEIFGPVAALIPFADDEDALRIANGTVYSLAAGVWTADIARAHRFTRRLKAGTGWVTTFGPTDVRLPWGGSRDSGLAASMATWPLKISPRPRWCGPIRAAEAGHTAGERAASINPGGPPVAG